jgi:hypothetical protein
MPSSSLPHYSGIGQPVSGGYASYFAAGLYLAAQVATDIQMSSGMYHYEPAHTISGAQFNSIPSSPNARSSQLDSHAYLAAKALQQRTIENLNSAWKSQVLDSSAGILANDLTKTVKAIFQVMTSIGPAAIDLGDLPSEKVNGVHLAVVLRATMAKKEQTRGWATALETARAALRRDGLDEADALSGLIAKSE